MRLFLFRLVPDDINFDFIGKRWISFILSIVLIISSFILLFSKGLNYGIDFTGGILIEARSDHTIDTAKMRSILSNIDTREISIQSYGSDKDIMIRVGNDNTSNESNYIIDQIKNSIKDNYEYTIDYRKIDFVGPQIGNAMIKNGVIATLLSMISIMIYIWIRFNWQYGVGLLIALFHDIVLIIGLMSFTGLEFNLTSLAAILTIIGYSVNDSVVIYDRIRENISKNRNYNIYNLLNNSINNTLSRTILTVLTTLFSALALIIFGGEAIRSFSILVFSGIIIGTYSSIYISAPTLYYSKLK